jgi:hypothetical protein
MSRHDSWTFLITFCPHLFTLHTSCLQNTFLVKLEPANCALSSTALHWLKKCCNLWMPCCCQYLGVCLPCDLWLTSSTICSSQYGCCCTQFAVWLLLHTVRSMAAAAHSSQYGCCCTQFAVWLLLHTVRSMTAAAHSSSELLKWWYR